MRRADYRVQLVDENGKADWNFAIVGDQVVDLTDADPGDVLVVQPDGTVAPDPPGAPGAHATTHGLGGTDELLLDVSQVNGLGSIATHAAGDYEQAGVAAALVDDLSGVTNAATARNNLGLGTAATHAHSDYDLAGAAAAAQAAAIAASQPVDSDLTAIAAIATTTFGRSLLALANAAALWTAAGLPTVLPGTELAYKSTTRQQIVATVLNQDEDVLDDAGAALSITFDVPADRPVYVIASVPGVLAGTANATVTVRITDGANAVKKTNWARSGTASRNPVTIPIVERIAAGSGTVTRKLRATCTSADGNLNNASVSDTILRAVVA